MNQTRLISNETVRAAVRSTDLIELMDRVFTDLSSGVVRALPRNAMFHPNGNILALMASSHPGENICGCKVAMFPGPAAAAGSAQSSILLFDVNSGALKAVVAAEHITVVRTAAATAAATGRLAREDAKILCLLGAGNQALAHAEAICAVRPIEEIRLWSRTEARLQNSCAKLQEMLPGCRVEGYAEAEQAVREADIVCTVSKAREPILFGDWLSPGCHVNAVGACGPIFREIDESVLDVSKVYVDSMDTALALAGDLLIPMKSGRFTKEQILGEVGQCGTDSGMGRAKGDVTSITLFESCGLGAQDVAAAHMVLERAAEGETFAF